MSSAGSLTRARLVTTARELAAADALAARVPADTRLAEYILAVGVRQGGGPAIAKAVADTAREAGLARVTAKTPAS